jgi:hypothetical protein
MSRPMDVASTGKSVVSIDFDLGHAIDSLHRSVRNLRLWRRLSSSLPSFRLDRTGFGDLRGRLSVNERAVKAKSSLLVEVLGFTPRVFGKIRVAFEEQLMSEWFPDSNFKSRMLFGAVLMARWS